MNDADDFDLAMANAVQAIQNIMPLASDDEAIKMIGAISIVVLETIKRYMPEGNTTCN
jgi:hypothetical protein